MLSNSSLKHTKPSRPLQAIAYHKLNGNPKLCVVECAKLYIEIRTELVPPEIKQFLVIYWKPHKASSDDAISRRIENTISSASIDIDVFKAHLTRSASSSKAKQVGIPYTEILKRGSWKDANTFTKHYDKHIINKGDVVGFDFVTRIVSILRMIIGIYNIFGLVHPFRNWMVVLSSSSWFEVSYCLLSIAEQWDGILN